MSQYEIGDMVTFLRVYDAADRHQACLDSVPIPDNHIMTGRIVSQGPQKTVIFVGGNNLIVDNKDIMDETRKVKVYKLEIMVIDFDNIGEEEIAAVIENARYPNHCIGPKVKSAESRTLDWNDNHPLNKRDTSDSTYKELFNA